MADSVAVLFGRKAGKIGELQIDAVLSEVHEYVNEVTEFPIETGATITDNIRILPNRIKIEGMVTNSPVQISLTSADVSELVEKQGNSQVAKKFERDGTPTYVEAAQDILLKIQGRKIGGLETVPELVTVVTGLRVYKNMAMKNLKIDRRASTGQALVFTAEFLEVQTVDAQTIAIQNPAPASKDKATSKVNKGNQTKKDTNEKQSESLLFSGGKFLGNAVKDTFKYLTFQ